jgi:hypothetical protein
MIIGAMQSLQGPAARAQARQHFEKKRLGKRKNILLKRKNLKPSSLTGWFWRANVSELH